MSCSCNRTACPVCYPVLPCTPCVTPTSCTTPTCTPCGTFTVSTPLSICVDVVPCSEGCEDTISCECVIYKGDPLGALGIVEGDTLCLALSNLNGLLHDLIMIATDIPNFSFPVRCMASDMLPISLNVLTRNGISQISGPVQYPNAQSALAFLQTVDAAWLFESPNIFNIRSSAVWTLDMGCPQ